MVVFSYRDATSSSNNELGAKMACNSELKRNIGKHTPFSWANVRGNVNMNLHQF